MENENFSYENTGYQSGYDRSVPRKQKSGPVTALVLALCMILSAACGAAAGYIAAGYRPADTTESEGLEILYKSVVREVSSEGKGTEDSPLNVPQVSALVSDSVVEITTESISTSSFMRQYVTKGAGSGVVLTTSGYIVTNYHVVEGATSVNVTLHDGSEYTAVVKGYDEASDIAVIKVDAEGLKPAVLGNSSVLAVGEQIVIIGNPLGELGGSVSTGIISALARDVYVEDRPMTLLQTDAAVNPGNSGGGMFNLYGELVGIVNAKSEGDAIDNIGFAIPLDDVKSVIESLMSVGYVPGRPYLGFETVYIDNAFSAMQYRVTSFGVYVLNVREGSNADKAGIENGDMIISINGEAVGSDADITGMINEMNAGDTVTVKVRRYSSEKEITYELEEYIPDYIIIR